MPLRQNPTAWFNLPGLVAAYQPIGAPGPLFAQYNMANGGTNIYKLLIGGDESYDPKRGLIRTTTGTIVCPIYWRKPWSIIVRFSNANVPGASFENLVNAQGNPTASNIMFFQPNAFGAYARNGPGTGIFYLGAAVTSGVICIAHTKVYQYGVLKSSNLGGWQDGVLSYTFIEIPINWGNYPLDIQAIAIYSRELSDIEAFSASRQMQYCDVNPDWSAWGRRRKWFYLAAAGAVRISPNTGLAVGGSPRIEPVGRVGL